MPNEAHCLPPLRQKKTRNEGHGDLVTRQVRLIFSEWFIGWDELPEIGSGRRCCPHLLAKTAIKLVR